MNAQQAPSWCCRHRTPSGALHTAFVVAHSIRDGSSHKPSAMKANVVRQDPIEEKRFAFAQASALLERVGGGSSGSEASRTKASDSVTQRSCSAWRALYAFSAAATASDMARYTAMVIAITCTAACV